MSKTTSDLDYNQFQKFQNLFLWLRLTASLFFVTSFWTLTISFGLFFSKNWSGLYQLGVGLVSLWLGKLLWDGSKIIETITEKMDETEITPVLLKFSNLMLAFFKTVVVSLIVVTAVSLLLTVIGILLVTVLGK